MKCPGMETLGGLRWGVLRDWDMSAATTPPDQVRTMEGVKGWQDGVHCVKYLTVIHKLKKQSRPNREELQWN